jgi:negative regulator of sigma E activity
VTGRRLYRYLYRMMGETRLETPLGVVRALHMHRKDPDGASMDVWLDLERNLLPARIHVVDRKGRVLRQEIREARLEYADAGR